jgi:hypothetical protein
MFMLGTNYFMDRKTPLLVAVLWFCILNSLSSLADELITNKESYLRSQRLKDFFVPEVPIQEIDPELSYAPLIEDFSKFEVQGNPAAQFFTESSSLSVGDDGVVRLVLAALTKSNVWSVTYEGYSCESNTFKIYATSSGPGEKWTKSRRSRWIPVAERDGVRRTLMRYYFCDTTSNSAPQIVKKFEKGVIVFPSGRNPMGR